VHVFLTSFYRGIGQIDRAREEAVRARELSPQKPHIILEQGIVEYQAGNLDAFTAFAKEAYDLAPQSADMQTFYAVARMLQGAGLAEVETIVSSTTWPQFASNNFALQSADRVQANDVLEKMLRTRIEAAPADPQLRVGLSSVQYRAGNVEGAIATLEQGIADIPSLQQPASCYIENLRNGREPGLGCE
jgi:tetratricopeptide (TPR) repeat protein